MSKWIPCSKRLPDDTKDVLVWDGNNMFVAWFVEYKWFSFSERFDGTPILAWMPLPSEPFFDEDGNDLKQR